MCCLVAYISSDGKMFELVTATDCTVRQALLWKHHTLISKYGCVCVLLFHLWTTDNAVFCWYTDNETNADRVGRPQIQITYLKEEKHTFIYFCPKEFISVLKSGKWKCDGKCWTMEKVMCHTAAAVLSCWGVCSHQLEASPVFNCDYY